MKAIIDIFQMTTIALAALMVAIFTTPAPAKTFEVVLCGAGAAAGGFTYHHLKCGPAIDGALSFDNVEKCVQTAKKLGVGPIAGTRHLCAVNEAGTWKLVKGETPSAARDVITGRSITTIPLPPPRPQFEKDAFYKDVQSDCYLIAYDFILRKHNLRRWGSDRLSGAPPAVQREADELAKECD
jgi:hypothetical protein